MRCQNPLQSTWIWVPRRSTRAPQPTANRNWAWVLRVAFACSPHLWIDSVFIGTRVCSWGHWAERPPTIDAAQSFERTRFVRRNLKYFRTVNWLRSPSVGLSCQTQTSQLKCLSRSTPRPLLFLLAFKMSLRQSFGLMDLLDRLCSIHMRGKPPRKWLCWCGNVISRINLLDGHWTSCIPLFTKWSKLQKEFAWSMKNAFEETNRIRRAFNQRKLLKNSR